jgi:hypothetical protein
LHRRPNEENDLPQGGRTVALERHTSLDLRDVLPVDGHRGTILASQLGAIAAVIYVAVGEYDKPQCPRDAAFRLERGLETWPLPGKARVNKHEPARGFREIGVDRAQPEGHAVLVHGGILLRGHQGNFQKRSR